MTKNTTPKQEHPTPSLPAYVTAEYLASLSLCAGKGDGTNGERCAIQEVRAWLALDAASDEIPDCVCPAIGKLVIGLNDIDGAHREAIKPLLPRLIGTRGDLALTVKRGFAVADYAVRVFAANALRSAGLEGEAIRLESLPPVVDVAASRAASEAASWAASEAASYAASAIASRAANASRAASYAANASKAASYAANASEAASRAASYAANASRAASYAASETASYAANASRAASEAASWAASEAASARLSAKLLENLLEIVA